MMGALDLFANPGRFYVNGAWMEPSSDATIALTNPSTEDVFAHVAEAREADVDAAVAAARAAFDRGPWPRLTPAERAVYLRAMADGVARRVDVLGALWTTEIGVAQAWAKMFTPAAAETFRYYASLADTFAFVERHTPGAGGAAGFLVREPVGVVAAIVPWNSALALTAFKIAPALIAGCTVIVKSPPEAPGAALVLAEIAQEIGLPPGVLNVLTAERAVSEHLIRHPDVDKVTFTGSNAAGKTIGAICGGRVARCTLELGGKSAALVLDDYDVAKAAEAIAVSSRLMTGQVCASLTRVVVPQARHDAFVEALSEVFGKVAIGDPFDLATDMGPLAMRRQRDRVERYIAQGRAEGARVATGGGRPAHLNRGFFVEPTVFCNVDNAMTIAREEIFGPVVSVIPARDEAEAVDIANDSPFGLNASVFTDDVEKAYRIARQLRSGTVGHNAFRADFSIAFGGFKQSGIGREGGVEGLLPFLESKTIILDDTPAHLRLS